MEKKDKSQLVEMICPLNNNPVSVLQTFYNVYLGNEYPDDYIHRFTCQAATISPKCVSCKYNEDGQ